MHPGRDETGTIRLGPTSTRTGGATQASGTDDGTESTTSSTSATGTGPAPPGMPITVIISGNAPTGLSPLLCWSRVGYVTRCDRPGRSAPCTPSPTSSPTYSERSLEHHCVIDPWTPLPADVQELLAPTWTRFAARRSPVRPRIHRGRYQLMRALNNGAMKQRPGREHSDPVSAIRTLTVYSWAPASNGVASVSNVPTGNDRRP